MTAKNSGEIPKVETNSSGIRRVPEIDPSTGRRKMTSSMDLSIFDDNRSRRARTEENDGS